MKKALIVYSGVDGQTQKIAIKIGENLSPCFDCTFYSIHQLPGDLNLNDYDLIVLGAAIRYGFFNSKFRLFADENAEILNKKNTAFYSVTLTARKPEKRTPETNLYTRKFLTKTRWHPKLSIAFAGALHYPRYAWYDRLMIKLIMHISGGVTDTSQDIEYTDWAQVEGFSTALIELN